MGPARHTVTSDAAGVNPLDGASSRPNDAVSTLPLHGEKPNMDMGITDRRALVTGATGGIGEAIARALSSEGARVAVGYHSKSDVAKDLAAELGADSDRAMTVRYDLADPDSAVDKVLSNWGGIDILVTSAVRWSGRRPRGVHFEDVNHREWEPLVRDNLMSTIRTAQRALPAMRAGAWGRIVLISSHVAHDGRPGQEFYGSAKAGLHGLARSLSWDAAPDGVLVNVLSPGLTTTARVLQLMPAEIRDDERSRTPSRMLSTPADIAALATFLASDRNRNITGELMTVAGGR